MKKLALIFVLTAIVIFSAGCKYNSKATITVNNVGALNITVRIQSTYSHIPSGAQDIFDIEWPGGDQMTVSFVVYPKDQPEKAEQQMLDVNDGDNLTFDIEFYPEN